MFALRTVAKRGVTSTPIATFATTSVASGNNPGIFTGKNYGSLPVPEYSHIEEQANGCLIDWDDYHKRLPCDETKSSMRKIQSTHQDMLTWAASVVDEPAKIDWSYYSNAIADTTWVKQVREQYDYQQSHMPVYVNPVEAHAREEFAEIMEKVEVQMEASAARLVELDVMIDEQKANRTTRDTTVDEVLARHPELAAQFDDDIANDRWFPSKNVADGLYTEENLAKWK